MNYGLYISASGAISHLHRQDVIANNLANANTVGFKPDMVFARQILPEHISGHVDVPPKPLLEMLGGGLGLEGNRISTAQGPLKRTNQSLDVAIEGEGFLLVRTGAGAADLRLTRDGRLSMDADGRLVMASTGLPVLGEDDRPIHLDRTRQVEIHANGDVIQGDRAVGRLQLASPRNDLKLVKDGDSLLRVRDGEITRRRPAGGRLLQGHVEASAVDPIKTLMALTAASKAVQANAKMMQYHDHIMGQAINSLGRVA